MTEMRTELEKLEGEIKEREDEAHKCWEPIEALKNRAAEIIRRIILTEGLLKDTVWSYEEWRAGDFCLIAKEKYGDWTEMEKLVNKGSWPHGDFDLDDNKEIAFHYDDGEYRLMIKQTPGTVVRWLRILGIKVDLSHAKESLKELETKADNLKASIQTVVAEGFDVRKRAKARKS